MIILGEISTAQLILTVVTVATGFALWLRGA